MEPAVVSELPIRTGAEGKRAAERHLREDLARGAFAPGQRLVEAELGERYHVTRNSARLAIDALSADGLVERIANRGARVRTVSSSEAIAIVECRMVLDGLLCAKAAEFATPADRARLTANLDDLSTALAEGDLLRYSDLIQSHHALVSQMAHQPVATALVERLQAQLVRLHFQLSLRRRRAEESIVELRQIVSAIVSGDAPAAEAAARAHLSGVIAALALEAAETSIRSR